MKKIRMGNLSIGSPKWITKVMIAAALCAVITVSRILSGAAVSYAAEKKQSKGGFLWKNSDTHEGCLPMGTGKPGQNKNHREKMGKT